MADPTAEDTPAAGRTTATQATRAWTPSRDPFDTDQYAGHAIRHVASQAARHGVEDVHFCIGSPRR